MLTESPDCCLLSKDEHTLLTDLVNHGLNKAIVAMRDTAQLAGDREPDVALSIAASVLLSVFAKARRDLTQPDGSNGALDAAVIVLNHGFTACDIPFVITRK